MGECPEAVRVPSLSCLYVITCSNHTSSRALGICDPWLPPMACLVRAGTGYSGCGSVLSSAPLSPSAGAPLRRCCLWAQRLLRGPFGGLCAGRCRLGLRDNASRAACWPRAAWRPRYLRTALLCNLLECRFLAVSGYRPVAGLRLRVVTVHLPGRRGLRGISLLLQAAWVQKPSARRPPR